VNQYGKDERSRKRSCSGLGGKKTNCWRMGKQKTNGVVRKGGLYARMERDGMDCLNQI